MSVQAHSNFFVLRLLTPASIIIALLIYRFIFIQIPKLKDIVNKTHHKIPITEFQIYTKLYVISSLSGILTITLSQFKQLSDSIPTLVYQCLGLIYLALYVKFLYEIFSSKYFNQIWKSRALAHVAYVIALVSIMFTGYNKLCNMQESGSDFNAVLRAASLALINWIPILLFFYGIVSVKEHALNFQTASAIQKYQPTHEFLEFTGQETSLSTEILDDYKKCDFYNFAFYAAFLFIITEHSFNVDRNEFLEFQICGLATYAIVNAYLYNWYGTCFDDFRAVDKEIASFKSSVELLFD